MEQRARLECMRLECMRLVGVTHASVSRGAFGILDKLAFVTPSDSSKLPVVLD